MDSPRTKAEWRLLMLAGRSVQKSIQTEQELTQQIADFLQLLGAKTIASYHAMQSEPSLRQINNRLQKEGNLVLPAIAEETLLWRKADGLVDGPHGTKSPTGPLVSLEAVDLMLLPALAVDSTGIRLGRGGGFYDRALGALSAPKLSRADRPLRVAVVYSNELVSRLPKEAHDVRVHAVVSEKGVTWFV